MKKPKQHCPDLESDEPTDYDTNDEGAKDVNVKHEDTTEISTKYGNGKDTYAEDEEADFKDGENEDDKINMQTLKMQQMKMKMIKTMK